MVGKFIVKWQTVPAPGLTFYEGEKRLTVNYSHTDDPFLLASERATKVLSLTFPAHRFTMELHQVYDWPQR